MRRPKNILNVVPLNGCYFDFKGRVKEFIDVVNQHIETVAGNKVMEV